MTRVGDHIGTVGAAPRPSSHLRLGGIVPPLCTPMDSFGNVDLASLERLVVHALDGDVDGLFVLGSTGEAVYLEPTARRAVVERVVAVASGHVPVVVGCIAPATRPVVEMANEAANLGADAVVVTVPFYGRTHPLEVVDHFRGVAAGLDVPVVAYDVPVSTNFRLPFSVITELVHERIVVGLKDSSGDDAALRRIRLATAGLPFSLLTGSELTVDSAILMGVDGAVPGLANVDPGGYVRLWQAGSQGRWEDARLEQNRLTRLADIIGLGSPSRMGRGSAGMSAFKTALVLLGVISGATVAAPLRSLDDGETVRLREILIEAGLL